MVDGVLDIELVPDEDALEDIEEKQLEIAGEPDAVGEAKELNEEQNEKLSVISRGIGRIASKMGVLTVIAGALLGLSKVVGELFDISMQDVRDTIVNSLNLLFDSVKNLLTGQGQGNVSNLPGGVSGVVQGTGAINPALPQILTEAFQIQQDRNQNDTGNDGDGAFLFTSREMMTGDSTQQEMQSQNMEDFIINGGS